MEKPCLKCGRVLPLDQFYRHQRMADGHLNKCMECTRIDAKVNRAANAEYYRAYDRIRFQTQARRDSLKQRLRRYRKRNPEKDSARAAVSRAIRSGELIRHPCEVCGCRDAEAHHPDYSKPLEVRWLCRPHHREVHREQLTMTTN